MHFEGISPIFSGTISIEQEDVRKIDRLYNEHERQPEKFAVALHVHNNDHFNIKKENLTLVKQIRQSKPDAFGNKLNFEGNQKGVSQ